MWRDVRDVLLFGLVAPFAYAGVAVMCGVAGLIVAAPLAFAVMLMSEGRLLATTPFLCLEAAILWGARTVLRWIDRRHPPDDSNGWYEV